MWSRRIIWLCLCTLSLVGISFYGGPVSYGLMCGIMLVPLVSLIYLLFLYFRFKVYQSIDSRNVICGQPVPYYFVLQNDDKFSFAGVSVRMFSDFSAVEDMEEDREYELLPGESFRYDTKLVCRYRGEYEVGVRECTVTDFFRLFSVTSPGIQQNGYPLLFLPRPLSHHKFPLRGSRLPVNLFQRVSRHVIPDRDVHIDRRLHHFPLQQGIYLTQTLQPHRLHHPGQHYRPEENKLLELVLALCFFFSEKQIPLSIYYGQGEVRRERIDSLEEFDAFYHRTPEIDFLEEEDAVRTAGRVLGELAGDRVVFLVVHEMRKEYLDFRRQLLAGGTAVFLYVVSDQPPRDYLRIADCSGILFTVAIDAELEEVL